MSGLFCLFLGFFIDYLGAIGMPVGSIQPIWCENSKNKNRAIDRPTRMPKALTIFFDLPLSRNIKTNAEPRLAKIIAKVIITIHFI
jgi:hypothetical protein